VADADILKELREQVLDESQSLVGLLRKCLALGAVTGSEELRTWATSELKGYPDDAIVPEYRQLRAPLFVDTMSGYTHTTGQQIDRIQVPEDFRKYVPEKLHLKQPIQDLAEMASSGQKSVRITGAGFSVFTAVWSSKLPEFQDVTDMYYLVLPSSIAGIVDMARTTLVEIVMDLAKDVPLDSLPSRATVDTAVQVHIGSNDNNSITVAGSNSGVIGQGAGSTQIQNNSAPTELIDLIEQLRATLAQVNDDEQRADAEQAIADFEESISEDKPEPAKVKRRWAMLERVGTAIGNAVLNQAVKEGTPLVMDQIQLMM
jgi:hypothetical protein